MERHALQKKSLSPLYEQLAEKLKSDIAAGVYSAGGCIPSEEALCEAYRVSRVTVRKALLHLVREGLLIRKQGKGTFIAEKRFQRDLHHITSFSHACRKDGAKVSSRVVYAQWQKAQGADTERLHIPLGEPVLEICRVRLRDGEPIMLEVNRFPASYGFLEKADLQGSLYGLLKNHGIVPSHAVHDISLGRATSLASEHLHIPPEEALLLLDETVYDQQMHPLHTSRQWIRGDKYSFRI